MQHASKWILPKTEFIYFGHTVQFKKCTETTINIAGNLIVRSDTIKYLSVWDGPESYT